MQTANAPTVPFMQPGRVITFDTVYAGKVALIVQKEGPRSMHPLAGNASCSPHAPQFTSERASPRKCCGMGVATTC